MEAAFRVSSRRAAVDIGAAARLSPIGRGARGALARFSGRVAQNVWERICRAGRFAIQQGVCTERVGTYAYRGAFPHFAGRVARNVSERIVLFKFFRFSRQGCTERVGTYVYGGTFSHLNGRVARNVWERIIL